MRQSRKFDRAINGTVSKHRAAPENPETLLSCLYVLLNEEWEHHRYAVRDLDAIDGTSDA
jgi:hypothetical protein